jgi:hypothetical protein
MNRPSSLSDRLRHKETESQRISLEAESVPTTKGPRQRDMGQIGLVVLLLGAIALAVGVVALARMP